MGIQQVLLAAGVSLIEPTVAVGDTAFDETDTRTYSGNGSYVEVHNDTYVIPSNWQTKDWRYTAQITSSASYNCIGYVIELYKNGLLVNSWSTPASNLSYFRYNSGTRTHTEDMSLAAGDEVQAKIYIAGRNVGGTTPSTTAYHELERTT